MKRRHKYTVPLLICALYLTLPITDLWAINVSFEKIDNRQGLSSDLIREICQDEEGFIWIATRDGLNCYTGTDVQVYAPDRNSENTLSFSDIRSICPGPNNTIWVGTTDKGVNIFNRQDHTFTQVNTQTSDIRLVNDQTNHMFQDSKDRVWISTRTGITMYDPTTHSSKDYLTENRNKYVTVVYEDSKGDIYAGTWAKSIYVLDTDIDKFRLLSFQQKHNIKSVKSLFEDHTGNLWIGTWGEGLYKTKVSNHKVQILEHIPILNNNYSNDISFQIVYDIVQDKKGRIWLGTDVGLGIISNPKSKVTEIDWIPPGEEINNFSSKDANTLFIDAASNIWIGTQGDGVNKIDFSSPKFTTYKSKNDISQYATNIYSSFWYHKDELYTGTQALGFGRYDLEAQEFTSFKDIPELSGFKNYKKDINAINYCKVIDDRYWWMITRYRGLLLYDTKERSIRNITFTNVKGTIICLLHEGNKVWIGKQGGLILLTYDPQSNDKLFPYKRTTFKLEPKKEGGIHGKYISSIIRDKDNRLWVSFLDGGIDEILEDPDPESTTFLAVDQKFEDVYKHLSIQTMYEDSRGNIWLGTAGEGLWQFLKNDNLFVNYGDLNAINGTKVSSIIEDNNSKIWISTNKGISSFNILDLENPYLTNYNAEDGLQGNIFIPNSVCKNKDGDLIFGGYHGFNILNPKTIKYNTYIPPIAFTAFEIDRKPINLNYADGERIVLNHKNNSCLIKFAALSYTKSINNQYQYKLEGYDQSWIKTNNKNNKATYGQLPAGNYTFMVKGSNNNGIWNDSPLSIDVHVKKSPYRTILAYIIYVIGTILIFVLSIYYTRRNFTLEQAVKDEQNERLRFEKINEFKLKFFTNISHELLTPLSIISNAVEQYVDSNPKEGAELAIVQRNTNRLTRLIDQLLDFRKVESTSRELMVEEADVNQAISSIKDNFLPLCVKKNITFKVNGEVGTSIFLDTDKLDKILHNILSNAFKHTPENGSITLDYEVVLKDKTEEIIIKITNTGKGIPEDQIKHIFDRFYRIDDRKHESGAGIGLAFTKSLVTLHKGSITAENSPLDNGITFAVTLPVSGWCYGEGEIAKDENMEREVSYSFAEEMDDIKVPLRDNREVTGELPKLLLVEDNHDMRNIMRSFLSKYFEIYESENGLEGLETLDNVDIEIIVSDIMMPKMDGLTFCRKVKKNISTCHIPIILTTAKRTQENFIEGYEALADSYITKPVNLKLLMVRIINLLEQRKKLHEVFTGKQMPDIKELKINNLDQQLLDTINSYIKENLNDSDLTVVSLAKHASVSTSVLYRKVKSFAGVSPNEYIRNQRLNYGAELLKGGLNPSEVTYECGFSDPSYFGACFKKQFGVPPSKYVESL